MSLEKLKELGKIVKVEQDHCFFYESEPGDSMYIILVGKVNILINSIDGSLVPVAELKAGDFFGEMSLLESMPRSATVMAKETTIAIKIDEENFKTFICKEPDMVYRLLKALSNRVRHLNEKICNKESIQEHDDQDEINLDTKEASSLGIFDFETKLGLFPMGHKKYEYDNNFEIENNIYQKEIKCPLCDEKFTITAARTTKIRLLSTDNNFRQHFENFEPLWYDICYCPKCYYSNFIVSFNLISSAYEKKFTKISEELKKEFTYSIKEPRNINDVFTLFYLALFSVYATKPTPINKGKLWLRLSWLYEDVNDIEMYKFAFDKAFDAYYEVLYNTSCNIAGDQEQRLLMLMAEMYIVKDEISEAFSLLQKSLKLNASPALTKQTRERILDIKEKR